MKYITKSFILFLVIIVNFSACNKDFTGSALSQQQDEEELTNLLSEIEELVKGEVCFDSQSWAYTPIGSKPCGGPWSYLAYPSTIDTTLFLEKVNQLRIIELAYNTKWNIRSDCSTTTIPAGINCVNETAVLVY